VSYLSQARFIAAKTKRAPQSNALSEKTVCVGAAEPYQRKCYYLIAVAMLLKRHTKADVMYGIAVIKQMAIAAAIKPYSIAVAPDSSLRNLFIIKLSKFY
jgi:hypothetical protein